MVKLRDWTRWLRGLTQGTAWVLLVLLAVLLLLAVDGLLLIPGLILAYEVTGLPWQWQGFIPDPRVPPGPWLSMAVGLMATLVPAIVDGLLLQLLLRDKTRRGPKSPA